MEGNKERLGRLVRARRIELGLTQRQAAERGGISEATWGLVENGREDRYADRTLHGVDVASDWPSGAAKQVLADRRFMPRPVPPESGPTMPPGGFEQLQAGIHHLVEINETILELLRSLARQQEEGPGEGENPHRGSP